MFRRGGRTSGSGPEEQRSSAQTGPPNMSKVRNLRALVSQRLTAAAEDILELFERAIAEYEDELDHRRGLLQLHGRTDTSGADAYQLPVSKEEDEQQEWSPLLDQEDPQPPHIKEEQEELWSSQEGEQLQGLEEADITKLTFTPVPVKSEEDDDEEKPQSSQLHQTQTEADGEDCGGPEPARNSDPQRLFQPDDRTEDSSETEDSDEDWTESRELQSAFYSSMQSNRRSHAADKSYSCSECGKRFSQNSNLKTHMRIHTGEKPFSCSVCGKKFIQKIHLTHHVARHTGEKLFGCSFCDKRFTWRYQLKNHQCVRRQSSQLHQTQTEQMETEADGEDCGGPEPARNSDPQRHLQPDADDKPACETEIPVSESKQEKKPFGCSECDQTFSRRTYLKEHGRCHTGEKSLSCSVCQKYFSCQRKLQRHMRIHSGEKRLSCSVCDAGFKWPYQLKIHQCVGDALKLQESQRQCESGWNSVKSPDVSVCKTGRNTKKQFPCPYCGKVFGYKISLLRHIRCHTGEKPYSCSVCGKRFRERGNMGQHMVVHTREKPFSCSVCDQRFSWRKQLKKHKCVGESRGSK